MGETIKYYIERLYPYVIALVISLIIKKLKITFEYNPNFNDVLTGIITINSIIIGFLGAVMPVVMSMKNESKFVKYVFEKDVNNLFVKYMKATIKFGLLNAGITLVMYVRTSIKNSVAQEFLKYSWLWLSILFFILTYRCMGHMMSMIFAKDEDDLPPDNVEGKIKSQEIIEFENRHKKDF